MLTLFNRFPQLFFAPDAPGGKSGVVNPSGGGGEVTKEDMIEFLSADDEPEEVIPLEDKTPPKGKGKEGEEEEEGVSPKKKEGEEEEEEEVEEKDELKEIEEELEEPTEEQLELVIPVRRREILKKYPQLFKDFPYLETAYYREQQFTELLPTIDDAKQAVEAKQILDRFENDVMGGNTETILKAVKAENPQGFYKIVDDYLPTLARVDEKSYYHILGNVSKHTIIAMVQEARRLGVGENGQGLALQSAANILNQFVFGSSEFSPPSKLSREVSPEKEDKDKEISEREQKFVRQQFESSRTDLNTRVNNVLKNTIDANIDPKKSMSDYVRKNVSRDALEQLEILISRDSRFKALTDKLWEKAFQEGFTKESTDRIRSAFVSKAKTLLPSVIKKARNDALRGTGKRVKDDEEETTPNKGPIAGGRPRSQQPSGKVKEAKDIPAGMSTLEFLNSD